MELEKKPIAILNLTGQLTSELVSYFESRKILVVDPNVNSAQHEWTHILTKDIQDFSLIRKNYNTIENDIKLISLSHVHDLQNFLFSNGKLLFDELWMKAGMGEFILDKFLQEYGGVAIGDSYPSFQELGSFNVVNPFNTGEYLDRMVHHAFSSGVGGLATKTFFDHLVMFLTGLKNKGKLGLPIEVTYGVYGELFGVQLHFFTNNLLLEDITSCLSNSISKKAEEYLLNVAVQSSDFFDFTFLQEVNKSVITALWTKDERIKYENRGMMFTTLSAHSGITSYPTEGITSYMVDNTEPGDFSSQVILPEPVAEENVISGEKFNESLAERISSNMEIEQVKQIISGSEPEEEVSQLVKGGSPELDEVVNRVKGKIEEDKTVFRVGGTNKLDVDKFAMKVSSGLAEDKTKGLFKNSIGSFPETVKKGLFDFAAKLGKSPESLSDEDLDNFKKFEVSNLIQNQANKEASAVLKAKSFFNNMKNELEENLKAEFNTDSVNNLLDSLNSEADQMKVKSIMKETLKKSMEDKFHLSQRSELSGQEQDNLVTALTTSLKEDEEKIRKIVAGEKAQSAPDAKALFQAEPTAKERLLEQKIASMMTENEALKNKVKSMFTEMKVMKESQSQINSIEKKAAQIAAEAKIEGMVDADKTLRDQFQQKLVDQKGLNESDSVKLASLLERESKLLDNIKQEEIKSKKMQIETTQKEAFFATELEKLQRQIKAKDLIINKTKESLTKISEKKDFEILDLHQKIDQMSKAVSSNNAQGLQFQITELERQNSNYAKMLDVYKNKISSLATNIQRQGVKQDETGSKEELRKQQMINQQYKNQLDMTKKELLKYQEKSSADTILLGQLKSEKVKLEALVKKMQFEAKNIETANINHQQEHDIKRLEAQVQFLDTQLKESQTRAKDLETRLTEAMRNQKTEAKSDDTFKARVGQLEGSVKKLTQDLLESRNQLAEMKKETNKLRQDKTGLQNQLDKLKKDMEKAKPAVPKKPGSGGPAGGNGNTGGKAA